MALTNKTNIRKRTVMDGLKKTFGKASQAISEKVRTQKSEILWIVKFKNVAFWI